MTNNKPPADYEALIRLIHERYAQMSKSYQKIAMYLTQNPNEVAVQPVNAISEVVGIHASNFVRFAQALGYKGFKELQVLFQKRLSTAAPGFEDRYKALREELASREDVSEIGFLHDMVLQDVSALHALIDETSQDDLARAADLIHNADNIYIVGQLGSEPVALLIRYMLTMLGKRCTLLDTAGGLATHVARTINTNDVLIAVSFRFYANETVSIVENTASLNIPIVAITDSTLSPLAKSADVLFSVPERDNKFTRSLSAPICLIQAIMVAVAARVQDNTTAPRIPMVTEKR